MDNKDEKEIDLLTFVEPQQPNDPAAQAFAQLRGEVALLRRAVEQLASERADIVLPDYSATLGKIALTLGEIGGEMQQIAASPALQVTPETLAQRIDTAAQSARRTDQAAQIEARDRLDRATAELRQIVKTGRTTDEQRHRLAWVGGGALLAGMLIWAVLPGMVARIFPESWHLPERIAARTVREPTLWEAGVHLMQAGDRQAWNSITRAADIARENSDSITACERKATKARQPVRCTIRIEPAPPQ
ncbi:MAG: hypothetical protein KA482_03515 [Sphingobium sp.]|nr:hypothetical protein [Sphingobium sp.]MBP8671557.1 hypothetical protein [Sphingobium sp.]MBP9156941.1 hypothetical protein [Sphingobium sp.]MCC6482239.1 hypothetical protein [Sphingomonadaceae bacterium]